MSKYVIQRITNTVAKNAFGVFVNDRLESTFCNYTDSTWNVYAPGKLGTTSDSIWRTRSAARARALELAGITLTEIPEMFRRES